MRTAISVLVAFVLLFPVEPSMSASIVLVDVSQTSTAMASFDLSNPFLTDTDSDTAGLTPASTSALALQELELGPAPEDLASAASRAGTQYLLADDALSASASSRAEIAPPLSGQLAVGKGSLDITFDVTAAATFLFSLSVEVTGGEPTATSASARLLPAGGDALVDLNFPTGTGPIDLPESSIPLAIGRYTLSLTARTNLDVVGVNVSKIEASLAPAGTVIPLPPAVWIGLGTILGIIGSRVTRARRAGGLDRLHSVARQYTGVSTDRLIR